jgi:hypothetical protein
MLDNIKVDLNEVSSYLWISIIAAIFTISSIRYNPAYAGYGLITFAYGIVGHTIFRTFDSMKDEDIKIKRIWVKILLELITLVGWLYLIVKHA